MLASISLAVGVFCIAYGVGETGFPAVAWLAAGGALVGTSTTLTYAAIRMAADR